MKALTMWQPWASLIAAGLKDVENRPWAPPGKYIGQRIALHAGLKYEAVQWAALLENASKDAKRVCAEAKLVKGAIIATAVIAGYADKEYPL
ncbi:MAG: hypothetical protein ACRD3I_05655, partial [Terriglobales bacterium]